MVTVEPTGPVRDPYLPKQMMAFITPDDPMVQLAMDDILKQRMQVFFTDFEELRDWVSWHITYVSDQQAHGTPDYWQLPAETLRLGAGDCEDFAILLCSLLRAAGAPADEVYVACGHNKDQAVDHAYLAEKWYTGLWQIVEPEAGVWMGMLMMDWATSEDYETIFCFNDQGFITGLPKLPEGVYEVEVPASFWPMFPGATVVYERYLQSGETVHAKVQWMKDYAMVSDWTFNIWGPTYGPEATNKKAYMWSGRDLGKSFTFTPQGEGIYRIEILKRDALPRPVRLTVDPEDWEPWPK